MSRASASRPIRSPAITDFAGTTSSWSAERTSTARRSWSPPTPRASRRVRPPIGSASSSAKTSETSASPTTSSRGRRRGTTTASPRTSSGRCTRRASSSSARLSGRSLQRPATRCRTGTSRARARSAVSRTHAATSATTAETSSTLTDLIDPRSKIDGTSPVFEMTKHLFLDLPAFKDQLTSWIEGKTTWRQNVRRFSLNFVQELKPRPITRDLDWGVPDSRPRL